MSGAVAGGIGVGANRVYRNRDQILSKINAARSAVSDIKETQAAVKDFSSRFNPAEAASRRQQSILTSIAELEVAGLSKEQLKQAWMVANTIGDPRRSVSGVLAGSSIFEGLKSLLKSDGSRPAVLSSAENFVQRVQALRDSGAIYAPGSSIFQAGAPVVAGTEELLRNQALQFEAWHVPSLVSNGITLASVAESDPKFATKLQQIQAELGGAELSISEATRPGAPGGIYELMFHGGNLGDAPLKIKIPRLLNAEEVARLGLPSEAAGKAVLSGTLGTLRTAGEFVSMQDAANPLNYHQFVGEKIRRDLIPRLMKTKIMSEFSVNKAAREFSSTMVDEYLKFQIGGTAPARLPSTNLQVKIGAADVHVFGENFGDIKDELAFAKFAEAHPEYHTGTSPGRVSKYILNKYKSENLRWFGSSFPEERRPLQPFREFFPTEEAQKQMQRDPFQQWSAWTVSPGAREELGSSFAPRFKTAYVSDKHQQALYDIGVQPGSKAIASELSGMRETQALGTINLEADAITSLLSKEQVEKWGGVLKEGKYVFPTPIKVVDKLSSPEAREILAGTYVGMEQGEGPYHIPSNVTISAVEPLGGGSQGSLFRLHIAETIGVHPVQKAYEEKANEVAISRSRIQQTMSKIYGEPDAFGAESIASMDYLRKNRSSHNMQMATSWWEFSRQQMLAGRSWSMTTRAKEFVKNPESFMQHLASVAKDHTYASGIPGAADDAIIAEMFNLSRESNLSPRAIGGIFGALPDVLKAGEYTPEPMSRGWTDAAGLQEAFKNWTFGPDFSIAETSEIMKGVAVGIGTSHPGGQSTRLGAGKRGTIEPRLIEFLQGGPQYGGIGPDIADEFLRRADPSKSQEFSQLQGALAKTLGIKTDVNFGDLPSYNLSDINRDMLRPDQASFIGNTGARVNMGGRGGLHELVLPKADDMSSLQPYVLSGGKAIESDLTKSYLEVLNRGRQYIQGDLTEEQFTRSGKSFVDDLTKATTSMLVGKRRGIASDKLLGSRSLQAVPAVGDLIPPDLNTMIVGRSRFKSMMADMVKLHGSSPEDLTYLKNMEEQVLSGKATAPAVFWRHPVIGPYSTQIGKIQVSDNVPEHSIVMPIESINVGYKGQNIPVDLGPSTGLAQDLDDDQVVASLLSPKLSEKARLVGGSSLYQGAERHHAIRMQLLKSAIRSPSGAPMTISEQRAAAALKLGTPQREVGRLSQALSTARAAVLTSSGSAEDKMNAQFLLEAIEQTPISGKFLASGDVLAGRMGSIFREVGQAVNTGKATRFQAAMEQMLESAPEDSPGRQLLSQDIDITTTSRGPGGALVHGQEKIKSLNVGKTSRFIEDALHSFKNSGDERMRTLMMRSARSGNTYSTDEVKSFVKWTGGTFDRIKSPVASDTLSNVARMAGAARNRMGAAGAGILRNMSKPLAIGFGTALAIGATLSRPVSNLDPDASVPMSNARLANSRISPTPENVHPDIGISGEPTPPGMPPGRVSIGPPGGYNMSVRGRSSGGADYGAMSNQVQSTLPGSSRVNMNVRDNRTRLNSQRINDMMNR
jgi:hypothetical protein